MKLPQFIIRPLAKWLIGRLQAGKLLPHPEGHLMSPDGSDMYMERGVVIPPRWWTGGWSARVHGIRRSDRDRALHCHPWRNITIVLDGLMYELVPYRGDFNLFGEEITKSFRRAAGDVVSRKATDRHRLLIPEGGVCYTLFITAPWQRPWGFHTAKGFVPWRKYLGIKE